MTLTHRAARKRAHNVLKLEKDMRADLRRKAKFESGARRMPEDLNRLREDLLRRGVRHPDLWISMFGERLPAETSVPPNVPARIRIPTALLLQNAPAARELLAAKKIRPRHAWDAQQLMASGHTPKVKERVLELLREGVIEPDMAMGTAESLKTHPDLTERVVRLVKKGKIRPDYLIMVGPFVDDVGTRKVIARMKEWTVKPGRIPTLRETVGFESDLAQAMEGGSTRRINGPFKANVLVAGPRDRFYMSLNPTPGEIRGMLGRGRKKLPVWRFTKPMIGSVMLEPVGDALMVREIQTGLFERNLSSKLKRRYNKWPEIMIDQVEDYARKHGFTRILMPTAQALFSHQGGMSPFTAHQLYTELPKRTGFSLKERDPAFLAMPHFLFWERKVPHGRVRNQ